MLEKVVVACSGSIAIYTTPNLIMVLRRAYGSQINVVMSAAASKFITSFGLGALCGGDVLSAGEDSIDEARLKRALEGAAALVIAPASANLIANLRMGDSEQLICRAAMMFEGPVVVAPAMNGRMWENPATQRNIAILADQGMSFVGPSLGIEIATYEPSVTALASVDDIVKKIIEVA